MRRLVLGVLVNAAVLFHAGTAFAHEEITPASVPTGTPAFLVLSAANEARADLVRLTLVAPDGVAFGNTTRDPSGWSVTRAGDRITWSGGAVKPDHFEQWGFEIEGADQPGSISYRVTLGYADGTSEDARVDVAVTASGAGAAGPARADQGSSAGSNGTARTNGAYGLAVGALALGAVALARTRHGRSGTTGPPPSPAASPGAGTDEQDW